MGQPGPWSGWREAQERLEAEIKKMITAEGPRVTGDDPGAELRLAMLYPRPYRALLESGPREYRPIGRPGGPPGRFRKMADKQCFANAQRAVRSRAGQGYVYAEGFALTLGHWWHHAWVADQGGNAIEVTWRQAGERYIGTEREFLSTLLPVTLHPGPEAVPFGVLAALSAMALAGAGFASAPTPLQIILALAGSVLAGAVAVAGTKKRESVGVHQQRVHVPDGLSGGH